MKLGFLGLGKMGSRMVQKLLREGHEVVAWNRSPQGVEDLQFKIQNSEFKNAIQNLKIASSVEEVVKQLDVSRVIWSMLPSGEATETMLQQLSTLVSPGDIVIDGANNQFRITQKHYEDFTAKGIRFLGIGVSGGVIAATEGYPLMVGGDKSAYEHIIPILDSLSKPKGGHEYFGEGGAGHFVKMVHNGIEYGIMQSLSEGFDVMEHSQYHFDLLKVAKLYQKNSLVSGFMLDRVVDSLEQDPHLDNIVGEIDATGEAEWTINVAKEEGIEVPSIELALEYRKRSKLEEKVRNSFTARMIAALRNAFGGHAVKKKE